MQKAPVPEEAASVSVGVAQGAGSRHIVWYDGDSVPPGPSL